MIYCCEVFISNFIKLSLRELYKIKQIIKDVANTELRDSRWGRAAGTDRYITQGEREKKKKTYVMDTHTKCFITTLAAGIKSISTYANTLRVIPELVLLLILMRSTSFTIELRRSTKLSQCIDWGIW